MSCGVGRRRSLNLTLPWLWLWPAAAAPIQTLAWEISYAVGAALKGKKTKNKNYVTMFCDGQALYQGT